MADSTASEAANPVELPEVSQPSSTPAHVTPIHFDVEIHDNTRSPASPISPTSSAPSWTRPRSRGRRNLSNRDDPSFDVGPGIVAWVGFRLWCLMQLAANSVLLGFGVEALVGEPVCDSTLWTYTIVCCAFRSLQILLNGALLFVLPHRIRRFNYSAYRRTILSKWTWVATVLILVAQAIMVPIGFSFLYGASPVCQSWPQGSEQESLLTIITYFTLLIQVCAFTLLSLPAFCLPCSLALSDLPRYSGISSSEMSAIASVTIPPLNSNPEAQGGGSTLLGGPELPSCCVCLEDLPQGTRVKQLACGHVAHENCLATWFEEHRSCPYCRGQAVV